MEHSIELIFKIASIRSETNAITYDQSDFLCLFAYLLLEIFSPKQFCTNSGRTTKHKAHQSNCMLTMFTDKNTTQCVKNSQLSSFFTFSLTATHYREYSKSHSIQLSSKRSTNLHFLGLGQAKQNGSKCTTCMEDYVY